MNPTIGVVIPTFDRAAWVVECVESVLAQSRPAQTIVVVDDGSRDDTAEALTRFDGRIAILRQDHAGPAAAKNRGARATATEWVVFLDSDDRLVPHALETIERAVERRPTDDLVSFKAEETDRAGRPNGRVLGKRSAGTRYSTAGLLRRDAGGCSWFAVRRCAFDAVEGFDENLQSAEECDFVIRLSAGHSLTAILEPLVLRRLHEGMLSADRELNARCWLRILDRLQRTRPEWVREHRRTFERSWSKEHLRLAKALLAHGDSEGRSEARQALRIATRYRPTHLAGWFHRLRAASGS